MLLNLLICLAVLVPPAAGSAMTLALFVHGAAKIRERREKNDRARYPVLYALRRIARIAQQQNGFLRREDLRPLFEEGVLDIDPCYFTTTHELIHWLYSLLDRKGRNRSAWKPLSPRPQAALVVQPT